MSTKEKIDKVMNALLHPKYKWRTVQGIAKESGLSEEEVEKCLEALIKQKRVRKSYVPDVDGRELYGVIMRVDADYTAF